MKFDERRTCYQHGKNGEIFTEYMGVNYDDRDIVVVNDNIIGWIYFTETWGKPRFVGNDLELTATELRTIADKMVEEYKKELPNRERLHPDWLAPKLIEEKQ